jgi:hypothetical protein
MSDFISPGLIYLFGTPDTLGQTLLIVIQRIAPLPSHLHALVPRTHTLSVNPGTPSRPQSRQL